MGPNGSGKSTLAYSIAGHPKYTITSGTVTLDGEDVLAMTVDERARAGLFLAMQYPVEVPGVTVTNFLRTAKTAIDGEAPTLRTWVKDVQRGDGATCAWTRRSPSATSTRASPAARRSATRSCSSSCSSPRSPILDETDSGLDVDALKRRQRGRQPGARERRRSACC